MNDLPWSEPQPSEPAARTPPERPEFLDITAHDLRAPLANIRSYAEMARSSRAGSSTPTVQRALEVILRNADKALVLVQDYIDSRRAELEAVDLARSPVALSELWAELATPQLLDRLAERQIELRLDLEPDLPVLPLDRRRLGRVLQLLLDRAALRSPEGSPIVAFARREGAHLATGVADAGPPLPDGSSDLAFDRQASVIRERQLHSGLALPLARSVARAHGGEALLRDEEELHACVLKFPVAH